jgi:hypothetical protein
MGFLGGDNEPSRGEEIADQQLQENKAELEAKKQSLYQTRLDIIKGQGSQSWEPNKSAGITKKVNKRSAGAQFPFGGNGFLR